MKDIATRLARTYRLLKRTQPIVDEYDVVWAGPYYIPRRRLWCPSRFMLYRGTLYASLFVPRTWHQLEWRIGSDEVKLERGWSMSAFSFDEKMWGDALEQIEHRMASAVGNFAAYNRRVERMLPPACRTGKVRRGLTWPRDQEPPLPRREIDRFDAAVARASDLPRAASMSLSAYLDVVAVAYDAAFADLRPLSPREKYKRRADGRHGGLLDLPADDAPAFEDWYEGRTWAGTHPWEIVFGHPHGIMLSPRHDADAKQWGYALWVDSLGWYVEAARMAIALAEASIPFEFHKWKEASDALRGIDDVEIGNDVFMLSYEELREVRPDALDEIRWDRIPQLGPITPDQQARVERAEIRDPSSLADSSA